MYLHGDQLLKILVALLMARDDLTPREREILNMRFGLGKPKTLEETGRHFNVTRERVRQIQQRTLELIGEKIAKFSKDNEKNK